VLRRGEGVSNADVCTFLCKNSGFFEIYGVRMDREEETGLSQCGHGGKGGQFFAILCGRPLWTAANAEIEYGN